MTHRFILAFVSLLWANMLFSQNAVNWSFSSKDAGNCQVDLIFTASINEGWYTYSQFLESNEGPVPTTIVFQEGPHFKLVGKAVETGDKKTEYDNTFDMKLTKFKHNAVFTQRVEVKDPSKPILSTITYMVCNSEMCLPPRDVDNTFKLSALKNCGTAGATVPAPQPGQGDKQNPAPDKKAALMPESVPGSSPEVIVNTAPSEVKEPGTAASSLPSTDPAAPDDPNFKGFFYSKREINAKQFVEDCGNSGTGGDTSNWALLFFCFIGGLIALLTPCVFPMVPMTVSIFMKNSENGKGLRNALLYSAFIILIFTALGSAVTAALGPSALNDMSTNKWFNLVVFAMLVIFAFSFFGFYEINLPASWRNKSDRLADSGGIIGIFFTALTLVLVSFSCTGPIVGTLLVEAARGNAGASILGFIPLKPAIGMFGFGLGLALPFGLFAAFPSWLNALPRSGGWMDNVKVTLGLVELALAFKFLSTADMVEQWGLLRFETFLVIWSLLALVLAFYQFGFLRWKGNKGRPGLGRLTVGTLSLAFAAYCGWGLANYKSLSLLSGLAPPVHYSYKKMGEKGGHHDGPGCPQGLDCYHDFDEALAIAKLENKPLFVDFTGHGCVNCRKMEETVWPLPGIIERLRNDYIVVSLYVDEKVRLFPDNNFAYMLDPKTGEKLRTVGSKWASFQTNNFDVSAQPYYVLMHHDGKTLLNKPTDYKDGSDPKAYQAFLDCGLDAFNRIKNDTGERIGMK
jgi:thiol:disulfide interchange protein